MQIRDRIVELRRVPARDLIPHPRNWRTHPDAQKTALRDLLQEVGYADALLARQTPDGLQLIDGHLRATTTPDTEVPVLILDVDEAEADKILATLDPLAALAIPDESALASLIEGVTTDSDAIRELMASASSKSGGSDWQGREDSVPDLTDEPTTKLGDLWLLGPHRLLCGDATNIEDVARLMDGKKAKLFATDPPYLVDYTGSDRPSHGKDWSSVYKEIEITDPEGFFTAAFTAAISACVDDAAWYCWHAYKRATLIEQIWDGLGVLNHQQIIWVKPCFVHGYSFYPWRHEPCLMGWRKSHKPKHDGKNSDGISSVWEVDWEGKARVVGNEHPTQKPVELFAIPMRRHTKPGDIVYEPFSGSGSQIIAAEKEGRSCYAVEIEPRFVDVAVKRWEQITGQAASRM